MTKVGDIFRVRIWDHHRGSGQENVRFNYNLGKQPKDQKTVALMLFLGQEPCDESKPGMDLEAAMNRLGWVRKDTLNGPDSSSKDG